MCNEEQSDWDEKIDTVLMGYHASHQASTNHSPYFMLFQQNTRLPIDAECLSSQKEKGEEVILDEVIDALIKSREKVFKDAEVCIKRAQKSKKRHTTENINHPVLLLEHRCYLRILHRSREKVASWSLHG